MASDDLRTPIGDGLNEHQPYRLTNIPFWCLQTYKLTNLVVYTAMLHSILQTYKLTNMVVYTAMLYSIASAGGLHTSEDCMLLDRNVR